MSLTPHKPISPITYAGIFVCTARRPQPLRDCLASLVAQETPETVSLSITVIDNEPEPNNRAIVAEFPGVAYFHEPRPGLVMARNAALNAAINTGVDVILFTDDDCVADPHWAASHISALELYDADIIDGDRRFAYVEPRNWWITPSEGGKTTEGATRNRACTANMAMKSWLIRPEGDGLRFDPRFNFTGGEDTDFAVRCIRAGAIIRYCSKAIIIETVTQARQTYWAQITRRYQYAVADTTMNEKGRGPIRIIAKALRNIVIGGVRLLFAVTAFPISRPLFKHYALRGGKRVMVGIGSLSALSGWVFEFYRTSANAPEALETEMVSPVTKTREARL